MNLEVGKKYCGFTVKEKKEIHEIECTAYVFEHDKTKAPLVKLVSEDDNKVFGIGFRTPPEDSTGVPHILEHSVLCGSRKYDTKEPFVELVKSSLNTFLNAMTYPDKTIYPVASRNEKDFFNLMDVYLDGVFYPNIYKHKEIFMQEGWHHKLESKEDNLEYSGVVYSEMKGVYSSPESYLYRQIPKIALSDTQYSNSSGGDPEYIPDLTYDDFISFHKKYYHPSNSYIFLYGNGDTEKELNHINEYLDEFDYKKIDSEIREQGNYDNEKVNEIEYGVDESESLDNKAYFNMNFIIDKATNNELYYSFELLNHMILSTSGAPLKKALIDSGIAKSVSGEYDNGMKQTLFSIVGKNCDENKADEFKKIVFDVLNDLVKNGIGNDVIEASVNKMEFALREAESYGYPKGLVYYTRILDSSLYGGDPLIHLEYEEVFSKIRKEMFNGYFENLIKKYILDNKNISFITMKPAHGVNEKKEEDLKAKLSSIKNSLSDEELEKIISDNKTLLERQNTPDSKEKLQAIPFLEISDISPKIEKIKTEVSDLAGNKLIHHVFGTNGISYISLNFNTNHIEAEKICALRLLSDVLGKLDTKKYDYVTLNNEVNKNIGEVSYIPTAYSQYNLEEDVFDSYFTVRFKCLLGNVEKSVDILRDIIIDTDFTNENRLKQVIGEIRTRLEAALIQSGHMITYRRLLSYMTAKGVYDEKLYGLSYYKYICDIEDKIDKGDFSILQVLKDISKKIFINKSLTISFAGEEDNLKNVTSVFEGFINSLYEEEKCCKCEEFNVEKLNEGIMTQSDVNYVGKGGHFNKKCYNGALNVLETILSYDYLWNTVRVKGGAYGIFSLFRRDGSAAFLSYRDPNINKTYNAYDGIPAYLESFTADKDEMTKYILGTISKLDQPLSNDSKASRGDAIYFTKLSDDMMQKERDEVIGATEESIKNFAPFIEDILKQDYICTLGNEKMIKEDNIFTNKIKTK